MILTCTSLNDIRKSGYLGNQMFIIASIVGIAKRLGCEYIFPHWNYSSGFNMQINTVDLKSILPTHNLSENKHGYDIKLIDSIRALPTDSVVNISGYLQDFKYFDEYRDLILNIFGTDNEKYAETAIHVRRGDYLRYPNHHPICSIDYYMDAINMIVAGDSQQIFKIYSDDIPWCRKIFVGNKFIFSNENSSPQIDMISMSKSVNNIIANSSFSWWSAYLNKNKNKTVIAPKIWFGSAYATYDISGFYLPGWNVL